MEIKMRELFSELGMDPDSEEVSFGFHWPPYTSVDHLHLHGMGPVSKLDWLGRWKYKQNTTRYCSVSSLQNNSVLLL